MKELRFMVLRIAIKTVSLTLILMVGFIMREKIKDRKAEITLEINMEMNKDVPSHVRGYDTARIDSFYIRK